MSESRWLDRFEMTTITAAQGPSITYKSCRMAFIACQSPILSSQHTVKRMACWLGPRPEVR